MRGGVKTKVCSAFLLLFLTAAGFVGCAPTTHVVKQEVVKKELLEQARQEGEREGFKKGYAAARAQFRDQVYSFTKRYERQLLYLKTVQGGVLEPGEVGMFYKPPVTSKDGQVFSSPQMIWKVVSPPRFRPENAADWFAKDKANFCYFVIDTASGKAAAFRKTADAPVPSDYPVFLMSIPYDDGSGRYAVIGKTPIVHCKEAVEYYKKKGYDVLQVLQ